MKISLTFIASIFATVISFAQTFSYNGINYNVTGGTTVKVGSNPSISGSVVIPDTVIYLGSSYIVTSIGELAFFNSTTLNSIILPNSVTIIGNGAFEDCSALTLVILPNSLTDIGDYAFYNCYSLNSINISNSITSIGNSAFFNCSALTSIFIPNNITNIESSTFSGCTSLTSITIPNSVTSIGAQAFNFCSSITSITIPNSVTSIGNGAFSHCYTLTSINIPNSIISIGNAAFSYCSVLASINIPNSITSIGSYCFQNCIALTSISIPNTITSIGIGAFYNCYSLNSINIPNSVTSIGDYAFQSCTGLTSISIPNSVTSIGNYAFQSCSALASINIPSSITNIGSYCFLNCSSLTSISIPNTITSIGIAAFKNCSALTSICIPNSVTNIGNYAFQSCNALNLIVMDNLIPLNISDTVFYGLTVSNIGLCIPIGSLSTYQMALVWQDFNPITESATLIPTFDPLPSYCVGSTIAALPTTSTNGVTGTWSPAINSDSTTLYTFTPTSGCAFTTMLIVIDSYIVPTFDSVPSYCSEAIIPDLPITSNNGIVGTWSPIINSDTTTLYTYTPSSGCALSATMLIIIDSNVVPTFDPLPSYCSGATIPPLPTTSTNGVIGTWSPAINPFTTTLYTFTPTSGCATTTMLIQIIPNSVPTFDPVPTYCSGAIIPDLPTTSNNGFVGSWSPAINSDTTTIYTFTPSSGCVLDTTLTIQIYEITGVDVVSACNLYTWIDGNTYTSSNNTATFTLTNAAGCDSVVTLNLIIKNATLTNTGLTNTSTCQGTLEATMIGGTAPFSYIFNSNPPQDSSTLIYACAGFNYVAITDAVGCSADANYFLPYDASSQPLTAFVLVTAASQTGVCDGEAEVFVTSGTAPYTFSHSTGTSTSLNSALCEGVYSVSVTDALGATLNLPYMVAADTNTLFIYQDDTSNAYNTTPIGAIENCNIDYSAIDSVTVASVNSFAIDSVTVIWNVYSGGGNLEVIPVNYYIGFGLGYYNFILDVYCPTKNNGKFLKVTAKVNVSSLANLDENANLISAVYPNPFTGNLTVSLSKENQYTLSFYDISGRILFSKKYDNTNLIELSELDYLAKGEYLLQIQSAEGVIVRKVVK
jgi:BspA type Leucine rich repeat region (6 copies)/Secretion system C-terminal sorting domain/Leucine rich repeat